MDDLVRLRHMLDASQTDLQFIQGESRNSIEVDTKLAFAIVRAIEIIGKAASKITSEFREKYSEVPWKVIISMRNRLIHGYFEIDADVVWKTLTEDLPSLIPELERIIMIEEKKLL